MSRLSRRKHKSNYKALAEINITPFVDVMLVLLIIFMVTAPLMTVSIPVELPKANARNEVTSDEPIVVSVDKAGALFLNETKVSQAELMARLAGIREENPEARIFVRGDEQLNYARIIEVMGDINRSGFTRIGLVAELPE